MESIRLHIIRKDEFKISVYFWLISLCIREIESFSARKVSIILEIQFCTSYESTTTRINKPPSYASIIALCSKKSYLIIKVFLFLSLTIRLCKVNSQGSPCARYRNINANISYRRSIPRPCYGAFSPLPFNKILIFIEKTC